MNPMIAIQLECDPEQRDFVVADLWEQGSTGITELEAGFIAFFREDGRARQLLEQFRSYSPHLHPIEDEDWLAIAREQLQPVCVGERFHILPEWRQDPTPPGRIRIVVNPGLAFGTGAHATTQLCLEALEKYVSPGSRVLDVGTGSGILAEAAVALGAAQAVACDTDLDAVQVARKRVANVFLGSVDAVASSSMDLLVANIAPAPIRELAGELLRCLKPRGRALLSGFEEDDLSGIQATLGKATELKRKDTWMLAVIEKPSRPA
jgi:ribosomal protein L11 methyltransferase